MTAVRQCAILVGGLGTRLGSLVADTPKPMLDVAGRPFLAWLLREVARFGIQEAILLTGYRSEVVEAALPALAAALPKPMRLIVSREPCRAGTGGALHNAAPLLQDRFLLLNGDSLFDVPALAPALVKPALATSKAGVLGHLMLRSVADISRYGVVTVQQDRITAFRSRPDPDAPAACGLINGGVYVFDRAILDHIGPNCSLEQDVLPGLAQNGQLRGSVSNGWFIDIGIPIDLARAQIEVPQRLSRPALFLDRDGVCNIDHGWVGTRDRFDWVPGAQQAIARATNLGWHVFIVTNQSGVARGYYTEDDVRALHQWMQDQVMQAGGTIDDARFCPYHPEAPLDTYRRTSSWRKPSPGMLLDLLKTWNVAPSRSLLVGDQPTDLAAATAAGIKGHLFTSGNLETFVTPLLDGRQKEEGSGHL